MLDSLEQANSLGHYSETLILGMTEEIEQAGTEGSAYVQIGTSLLEFNSLKIE